MSVRHILRSLAIGAAAFVCLFMILPLIVMYTWSWGVEKEFDGLPGREAALQLGADWPARVNPNDVKTVSRKYSPSRDSHSDWYRVELSPGAAQAWPEMVHLRQELWSQGLHDKIEGVRRKEYGTPPLHNQTGDSPSWWAPTEMEFRATEVMVWYEYDSGVGRATYSGYDESTGTLWVYDYAAQHDLLWDRGKVPEGDQFFFPDTSRSGIPVKNDSPLKSDNSGESEN